VRDCLGRRCRSRRAGKHKSIRQSVAAALPPRHCQRRVSCV
jgi:hypothetical protein